MTDSVTLIDAQIVIDGYRQGWLESLASTQVLRIATAVQDECSYFKNATGARVPIDFSPMLSANSIRVESATIIEIGALETSAPGARLGAGETESIALALSRGHRFCTSDGQARGVMIGLGIAKQWVSLPTLFRESELNADMLSTYHLRWE